MLLQNWYVLYKLPIGIKSDKIWTMSIMIDEQRQIQLNQWLDYGLYESLLSHALIYMVAIGIVVAINGHHFISSLSIANILSFRE